MSDIMATPQIDMSEDGEYAFADMPMYENYQILPEKNDNYLNGVSTLDLILIQRHILGIQALDSPYKLIAADINNSQSIDGLDLVELRKLILGIYVELPQNASWRFVDANYEFALPASPWPFDEDVSVPNFSKELTDADFIGVKVGDVNLSAATSSAQQAVTSRSSQEFNLGVNKLRTDRGNTRVQLVAGKGVALMGNQMSFEFDSPELLAIVPMAVEVADDNVAWELTERGTFRMSWNTEDPVFVSEGDVLFECLFKGNNESLELDKDFNSEVYYLEGDRVVSRPIVLGNRGKVDAADALTMAQNVPNPFKESTVIEFTMPQAGMATLSLSDVDGKLLHRIERQFTSGANQMIIDGTDINYSGVVYYQLNVGSETITKKMIVLK